MPGPRTNLPPQTDLFIGRERTLRKMTRYLDEGERMLTLIGSEGSGKSHLARRFAVDAKPYTQPSAGGAWYADLHEHADLESAVTAIADALDVPLHADEGALARLGDALSERGDLLLVLDGVDRIIGELSDTVETWLAMTDKAVFLLTSRQPLGIEDEVVVKVGALRAPSSDKKGGEDERSAEAVRLFVERARESVRGYTPRPEELPYVAEIVRRLGGLPLAIELAAARVATLSPAELLERLPRRVDLLHQGKRKREAARPKRATVTYTIDWSWGLLEPWERAALAQSSVFRGGFDEDAADAVVDLAGEDGAPELEHALDELCAKSLLRREGSRFSHYASVRDFAEDHLDQLGDAGAYARHAKYYLARASRWADDVDGPDGRAARQKLEREVENLLAVVRRGLSTEPGTVRSVTLALEAILSLEPVLTTRGPFAIHLDLLDAAIAPAEVVGVDNALLAKAHESRGRARRGRGMMAASLEDLERALDYARLAQDRLLEGRALANIGTHHLFQGDPRRALSLYEDAVGALREVDARRIEGRSLAHFGLAHQALGAPDEAARCFDDALAVHRETGDLRFEGITRGNLGKLHFERGELDEAKAQWERALAIHKALGNRRYIGTTLGQMATLSFEQGRLDETRDHLRKALAIHREVFDRRSEGEVQARLGDVSLDMGRLPSAKKYYQRHLKLSQKVGDRRQQALAHGRLAALSAARDDLDDAEAALDAAHEIAERLDDTMVNEALKLYAGHLDEARARRKTEIGASEAAAELRERCQARINRALAPPAGSEPGAPPLADRSDEIRAALRSLIAARVDRSR